MASLRQATVIMLNGNAKNIDIRSPLFKLVFTPKQKNTILRCLCETDLKITAGSSSLSLVQSLLS